MLPPTSHIESDAGRWRALLVGAFLAAAAAALFGWQHPGHGVDWARYALVIEFVYGTMFVVLGIACLMQPAIESWPLSTHLRWLGGFALLHGGKELFDAWHLASTQPRTGTVSWLAALWLLGSFVPLLEFARRLWRDDASPRAVGLRWLASPWLYGGLLLVTSILALTLGALPAVHIAARWLVALPAASLTAIWLWRRAGPIGGGRGAATVAGAAMGVYALIAGGVVEAQLGTPAWIPTDAAVGAAAGVPVKLLRTLCALAVALAVSRLAMVYLARMAAAAGSGAAELARRVEQQTHKNMLAQEALDATQNAIAIADADGLITYVNASFLSAWGYRHADQVVGTHATQHWVSQARAREAMEALARESLWTGELEAVRGDGHVVPMRVVAAQIRNRDGLPVAMIGTFHDLSEVRSAQQAERLQRAFYEAIVDHAATMVLVLDAEGRIVRFNRACEVVSGRSREEVRGRYPWDVLLPPEQAEEIRKQAFAALASNPQALIGRYTNEWLAADGTRSLIDWYNSVLLDDNGAMAHMVSVGVDITERTRVRQTLAQSEHRLNEAQRVAQVGSWELDLVSGQLSWSDEIFRIFEIDKSRFGATYEAFLDAIHPEDRDGVNNAYSQSLIDRAPYSVEHRLRMQDGRIKWVQERCESEFDAGGSPLRSMGTVQDITERIRTEQSLRLAQAMLDEAQAMAHLGNWSLDLQSGVAIWSSEQYRLLGYEPGAVEAGRESFLRVVHPDDREQVRAAWRRALDPATDGLYHDVHRVLVEGRERYLEQHGRTTFDAEGRAVRIFGTSMDVTERQRHATELARYRDQLEALVDLRTGELERQSLRNALILGTAIDGFFTMDISGRLLEVNTSFCRMLGYSRTEMLALRIPDIEAEESAEQVAAHIEDVRRRGHDRFQTRHRRKDGSLLDVELSVNRVDVGDEEFFFTFVRDVSERLAAERSLRAAREDAEKANRAKSEFLSGMSHELRTPMNAILGFSQVLQMEVLAPRQADAVGEIYQAGQHLLALIDDLLDLTRIEAGKMAVSKTPVNVADTVSEALVIVQPMLGSRGLSLTNAVPDGVHVLADRVRLRQVLVNLLSNAAKYNRTDGHVSIDAMSARPGRLQLRVGDRGAGIAPEQMARLFQTFERLGAEHSGVEGSGIGLALSRRLAELMGGTLGVESRVGEGSIFWIELPVAASDAPGNALAGSIALPVAAVASFDVLYVEDNRANLKLVELVFQTRPHWRLVSATSGPEGLQRAYTQPPDAILLDIHLPGMDGYAVLQALQSDPRTSSVPVVALSADAMREQVDRGLRAGFHDYLPKPLDLEQLLSVMTALANRVRP